jgi:hypothetical protein
MGVLIGTYVFLCLEWIILCWRVSKLSKLFSLVECFPIIILWSAFLPRKRAAWCHPIGQDVSGYYNPHLLRTGLARPVEGVMGTTTTFIPDVRPSSHCYGRVKSHPSSHRLCLVTRLKQPSYWKKNSSLPWLVFSG